MLRVLIGSNPAGFLDAEPDLAHRIVNWTRQRRRVGRFEARDLARPLARVLEERFDSLWAQQARRLLGAQAHLAAGDPAVYQIATTLADGNPPGVHGHIPNFVGAEEAATLLAELNVW